MNKVVNDREELPQYNDWLMQLLKSKRQAAAYLQTAIEEYQADNEPAPLLLAFRQVAIAQGGMAQLAELFGLSLEIGAFIGGISVATSPIAQYIAVHLKPLRDFFLILFFFSLGASFNLGLLSEVILASSVLAVCILIIKPITFRYLLGFIKEPADQSWEVGFRLGQISEFSLLIAFLATSTAIIGTNASHVIQATAIITFILNSYVVIFRFPSPIAVSDKLRRD